MRNFKRIGLFVLTNIVIIGTITTLTSALGLQPALSAKGIDATSLILFCSLWGFGGAFISLAMSRKMAKWMMGVQVIDPQDPDPVKRDLVHRVHQFASRAGLSTMPEVGIYEGEELNAFATGPSKSRSLVAVSTGLLRNMRSNEVDGVLAHEVAHIANGDMVTMTLVQGVINTFVMIVARVIAFGASQFVDEEKRPVVQFGVTIAAEIVLGFLGMLVAAAFSRAREYRADSGGAQLSGSSNMIAALEALKRHYDPAMAAKDEPALASLKISGNSKGFLSLFSTHPDLNDRIQALRTGRI